MAATTAVSPAAIDRLAKIARRRYAMEAHGRVTVATLRRVGRDPTLLRTLRSGNFGSVRTYVKRQFAAVWYHWHVSRMRVLHGSQLVVDAGVPFVVSPSTMTLRAPGGRALATLEVSIQDVIGFVRYMHRNYAMDVVARGQDSGHVRSSLPAAAQAALPARGATTIAGRRYLVRSFHETALAGEPLTIWILVKG